MTNSKVSKTINANRKKSAKNSATIVNSMFDAQALVHHAIEQSNLRELRDDIIKLEQLELDCPSSSATPNVIIDDIHNALSIADVVENRIQSVEDELETKLMLVSDNQSERVMKNNKARLRTCEEFKKASEKALNLIVENSDEQTLLYLMNAKNYKTAQRILDCAHMLTESGKYSSILDYTKQALKRASHNRNSVDAVCAISGQCYARISNAVKALHFFNQIELSDCTLSDNKRLVLAMSKNTMISVIDK
jgi:tetratricopeptide (TPR) repeat protein